MDCGKKEARARGTIRLIVVFRLIQLSEFELFPRSPPTQVSSFTLQPFLTLGPLFLLKFQPSSLRFQHLPPAISGASASGSTLSSARRTRSPLRYL
jgi:hypothetical protein